MRIKAWAAGLLAKFEPTIGDLFLLDWMRR
jgi:hypothetical protein